MTFLKQLVTIAAAAVLVEGCTGSDDGFMTNTQKAVAVLEALENEDSTTLEAYISKETYIQHNLDFPDGRDTLTSAVDAGFLTGTTVDIVRTVEDGDVVITHSDYFFAGEKQVGFDLFRFKDGLIVEHWDNLQAADGNGVSSVNGNTMLDGPTEVTDTGETDANKTLVRNFVNDILLGHNTTDGAFETYFELPDTTSGDNYRQHNPEFPNGTAAVQGYIQSLSAAGISFYTTLHFVYGQGNFVLTLSEGPSMANPAITAAYYDLFRVENAKIVEHWDVIQDIPDPSLWQNNNGKW